MAPISTKRRASREIRFTDFYEGDDDDELEAMTADSGGMVDGEMETEGVDEAVDEALGDAAAPPTKKKRQNLTHLTEEEKLMRRKLKNR